jgi:ABC-2 type transport system ATP-binding protein/lipopolysaccharide transport system ATP-binding protein
MTRRRIEERVDDIADFTELGDHLDLPVYTYSAGMRARLAFAISTAVEPEILLMDEWIGVGDSKFIQKARRRLRTVVDNARILVLASHNKMLLRKVCNKIIELEAGCIQRSGDPQAILGI